MLIFVSLAHFFQCNRVAH